MIPVAGNQFTADMVAKILSGEQTLALADLIGEHVLSGVERGVIPADRVWGSEDASTLALLLDGICIIAVEDPEDGYRSTLSELKVGRVEDVKTTFEPIVVVAEKSPSQHDEIVIFTDKASGRELLVVGTQNDDDYYPSFVAKWRPENLPHNHPAKVPGPKLWREGAKE